MPEPMARVENVTHPVSASTADRLLAWYDANARLLPWRLPPGSTERPDPYPVWLSEVMSQQTTLAAMTPYWQHFVARWPDVNALAAADGGEVMAAWAGLGYYARARNLHACAQVVVAAGGWPDTTAGLRALPGIGAYTAGAIAAICFGEAVAAVDGNAERVAARVMAEPVPVPTARPALRRIVEGWVPAERPGDFAQALMDLGATVCTPRLARCPTCPLSGDCRAHLGHNPTHYPLKAPRKVRPHRIGTAWWVERDGSVALVRRSPERMLGGTLALPSSGWDGRESEWPDLSLGTPIGTVTHHFTHFTLTLSVERIDAGQPPGEWQWWPLDRLAEAGLASLFVQAAARAMGTND